MNHQLTIVSKKSGTVKGLGENAGNNKGKRVQKGAETKDGDFDYVALGGSEREECSPLRLTLAQSDQTTISGRLPDDQ